MQVITAPLRPTTAKVLGALGAQATRTSGGPVVLDAAAAAFTYLMDGPRFEVTVVVSRRGGRIVRANHREFDGGFQPIVGTVPQMARQLLDLAARARAHNRME